MEVSCKHLWCDNSGRVEVLLWIYIEYLNHFSHFATVELIIWWLKYVNWANKLSQINSAVFVLCKSASSPKFKGNYLMINLTRSYQVITTEEWHTWTAWRKLLVSFLCPRSTSSLSWTCSGTFPIVFRGEITPGQSHRLWVRGNN